MLTLEKIQSAWQIPCSEQQKARYLSLEHALEQVTIPTFLEFGVDTGATINFIASKIGGIIYGFDSFFGLPQDWTGGFPAGSFNRNGQKPDVAANVELIVGLFEDTLPEFTKTHNNAWGFIHIDCDLYSSTRTVFDHIGKNIVPGTIIAFDELINYGSPDEYLNGEFKALNEFLESSGLDAEVLCWNRFEQVVVKITKTK